MKRCRLKRLNFQIINKMNKENKTSDNKQNGNDFIADVRRSFSYEEVQKIALDVMNLGMDLRQNQLNGWTDKSGNEILKEYMDRL